MTKRVVTYQSPNGETINLTPAQIREYERRGEWPRNSRGEEFCSVSHGLHTVRTASSERAFAQSHRTRVREG